MKKQEAQLQQRISTGQLRRQDVVRRLGELAFGRVNDCVRLVLEEHPVLEQLDLSLLSEMKRNEKGAVEIRLINRLQALEQLALMTGEDDGALEAFLQVVQGNQT